MSGMKWELMLGYSFLLEGDLLNCQLVLIEKIDANWFEMSVVLIGNVDLFFREKILIKDSLEIILASSIESSLAKQIDWEILTLAVYDEDVSYLSIANTNRKNVYRVELCEWAA